MAGDTRTLTVKWVGDTSSIEKSSKKAGGALSSVGTIAAGAFTGTALAAGATAVVGFLGDATKAAMEDEASQQTLAKTLEKTTGAHKQQIGAVEDYITKLEMATGTADDDLRPALSTLLRATHDVGKAQSLMGIAMDVSAGTGKDLGGVTQALAKAQGGSYGALKKLIPTLDVTKAKTEGMRYVQAKLNDTFGGQAAAAANTSTGKMKRLSVQWAEMKENVGSKLLPVLMILMNFLLNQLPQAIEVVVTWFQVNWPKIYTYIAPLVTFVQRTVTNVITIVRGLILFFQGLIQFIRAVFTGQWGEAWRGIQKMFQGIWLIIVGYFKQIWNQIQNIAFTALKLLFQAWLKGWQLILNAYIGIIMSIVGVFGRLPGQLWSAIINGIPLVVGAALSLGARVGGAIWSAITGALTGLGDFIAGIVKGAFNIVIDAWNAVDIGVHAHLPSWLGGFGFDIDDLIPDIPRLDKGGITKAVGLAVLHPNELVQPLPKGGMLGGNTYNIVVQVPTLADPVAVGRATVEAIRAYERRNGHQWRAS